MDVKGEEASNVSQPSDDEDRGLLRHGDPMEKKDAEKGVRARTVVDEEAELIRRDARSRWWWAVRRIKDQIED